MYEVGYPITGVNLAIIAGVASRTVSVWLKELDGADMRPDNVPKIPKGQRPTRASLPAHGRKLADILTDPRWQRIIELKRRRLLIEEALERLREARKALTLTALAELLEISEGKTRQWLRQLENEGEWVDGLP